MRFSVSKFLLVATLLSTAIYSYANTTINGAAIYTDLGSDVFIASLHLENENNQASIILEQDETTQMQVHLVNRMSKRRWVNMWMQSIAINNPRADFEAQAEQLVTLFDKFRGSLQTNDVFEITYRPETGSIVTLNNTPLLQTENRTFLTLFLRAWIGSVPPSTDFKKMILGAGDSTDLTTRAASISPNTARINAIKQWAMSKEEELAQQKLAQEKAEQERIALEKQAEEKQLTQQKAEAEAAAKAELEQQQAAELEIPLEVTADAEPEKEEVTLSVESILAQQEYTTYVMRSVYKKIRYPKNAVRRNQQGTSRVQITINRDGSLLDRSIVEESGYPSLDNAALKAIDKAAPFNGFPAIIIDENQAFTIPISFRLSE